MADPSPKKTKNESEAFETTPVHPDLHAVPTRRRFLNVLRDGDGLIVRRRLQRKGMRLNQTASAIWSLCDGQRSVASILVALRRTFAGTARSLEQEVLATLNSLADQRLLTLRQVPRRKLGQRRIDLREITFYVINCETDESRRESMERQLSELGLQYDIVVATKCDPGWIGCAISHLRILNRDQIRPPFAVLEDDCRFSDNFRYEFTVPANADALYLGVSNWGIEVPGELSWGEFDGVQWSRYDANNLRVFNMLAAHAILYLSDAFHRAARAANVEALANSDYSFLGDVGMASIQPSHLVLTPLDPICYQDSELGGDQGATMVPLAEVEKRRVEKSEAQNEASSDDGNSDAQPDETRRRMMEEAEIVSAINLDFLADLGDVPKIVHLSWKNKDLLASQSPVVLNGVKNIEVLNPDWEVSISDDHDVETYLKEQLSNDDYDLIKGKHIVEKVDLWRLLKMYHEGGFYTDVDRFYNVPLSSLLNPRTKCLLPMHYDIDFAQDIMLSAPHNPIHRVAIDLNLARRRQGCTDVLSLGPITYFHAVTTVLCGRAIDRYPPPDLVGDLRDQIHRSEYVETYREEPPNDTMTFHFDETTWQPGNGNSLNEFYDEHGVRHWTTDCSNHSDNKPFGP